MPPVREMKYATSLARLIGSMAAKLLAENVDVGFTEWWAYHMQSSNENFCVVSTTSMAQVNTMLFNIT